MARGRAEGAGLCQMLTTDPALSLASTYGAVRELASSARVSPGVFVVSPGVLENTWSSSLGIARRRSARPPQAAPSPRTTLFLIRAASAALKYWPPCSSTRLRAATAAAGARRATTGIAGPCRLPAKPWWKVHRDFIPWTTTPSTRPCRKRVNPLPDVAAAVRVADGYVVDEDRPSKRFLGCENVSYGQLWPINQFY